MTALVPNLSDQVLNTKVHLEFGWTVWTIILGGKEEAETDPKGTGGER